MSGWWPWGCRCASVCMFVCVGELSLCDADGGPALPCPLRLLLLLPPLNTTSTCMPHPLATGACRFFRATLSCHTPQPSAPPSLQAGHGCADGYRSLTRLQEHNGGWVVVLVWCALVWRGQAGWVVWLAVRVYSLCV